MKRNTLAQSRDERNISFMLFVLKVFSRPLLIVLTLYGLMNIPDKLLDRIDLWFTDLSNQLYFALFVICIIGAIAVKYFVNKITN